MVTLSVIIPVYKVEDYLERCVQSVLEQDYKDFEIILVDDGSPDRCPKLCDDLAARDSRIKVHHKENGGLSSARNAGIRIATGTYITFLDSDDQWIKGQLKEVMKEVLKTDAQMSIFDSINLYPDGRMMKREGHGVFEGAPKVLDIKDYYAAIIAAGDFHESACTKIFNRDFILDNDLFFISGITGEDSEWMFRVLRNVKRILILNTELFLCTCRRGGSIQNSIKAKNIFDVISTIEKVEVYNEKNSSPTFRFELEQCAYLLGNATGLLHYIQDNEEKKELKKILGSKAYLFEYATNRKNCKMKLVNKLFGFKILSFLLEFYLILHKKNILNKKHTYHG